MATKTSEKVYDVLVRFAEAASNYYQKESFVYHFGVVHGTANKYKLTCMDGGIRHFICNNDGDFWVDGTKTILPKRELCLSLWSGSWNC